MPALMLLRDMGLDPDSVRGIVARLLAEQLTDGYVGQMQVEIDDGEGGPSRWNTLRAQRVLDWWSGRRPP